MPRHATQQVHAGYEPAAPHRPVVPPIHQTTAFRFPDHATAASMFRLETPGFTYSRTGNPTVAVFENRLAALEGGIGAIATATGQAAVALSLLAHRLVVPALLGRPSPLHPLATVLAVGVGVVLAGVVGALLAVPLLAAARGAADPLRRESLSRASRRQELRRRQARDAETGGTIGS